MTESYTKLVPALKERLPASELAEHGRTTGFIQRRRTVGASDFVWAVVMSRFATGIPGFDQARRIYSELSGREIWQRPFQKRFLSEAAVKLFAAAFEGAVAPWRKRRRIDHPLAKHFSDIVAIDSTVVQLNDRLRRKFPGHMLAAAELKATLAISVFGLVPLMARITARKIHDTKLFPDLSLFRRGALLLFDAAYVAYDRLGEIARAGRYFVAPMRIDGAPRVLKVHSGPEKIRAKVAAASRPARKNAAAGVPLRELLSRGARVATTWDLDVLVFPGNAKTPRRKENAVRLRLVIRPGRGRSYFYLTNLTTAWKPEAIAELYRLRWQIELVFKELKQHLSLESIPTKNPHAVHVFVWASLLALTVSRTVSATVTPLGKLNGLAPKQAVALASKAIRTSLSLFVWLLSNTAAVPDALILQMLEVVSRMSERRSQPRPDSFCRLIPLLPA